MNVSLQGSQGSGKGTQVQLIANEFNFAVFESGKELRRIAKEQTGFGLEIKKTLESGDLIPDQQIYFLTKDWLSNIDSSTNIFFDGYPRKLSQAKDLLRLLADREQRVDLVIFLRLSDEISVQRLLGRLVCQDPSEHIFNTQTNPSKIPGICDFDGSPLVPRNDETAETIKRRLDLFHQETEALIEWFKTETKVEEIQANLPIPEVFDKIKAILSSYPQLKK